MDNYHPNFMFNSLILKKKVLKVFGGHYYIFDTDENLKFFCEKLPLKLREEFHIYTDQDKTQEVLLIKTPEILDFSASYQMTDPRTNEVIGGFKREGFKSILMDEWVIFSKIGEEVGRFKESSGLGAFLSRWIKWIPQHFFIKSGNDRVIVKIDQKFNPVVLRYEININEADPGFDRRLLFGMFFLLAGIEGRQQ